MSNIIKTHEELLKLHGRKVTCNIYSNVKGYKRSITDAKISVDDEGDVYICQNILEGNNADDKLGYEHSWIISDTSWGKYEDSSRGCTDLMLAETPVGRVFDIEIKKTPTPDWFQEGKAVLAYISDYKDAVNESDCRTGFVVYFDGMVDEPFRSLDDYNQSLEENLTVVASDLSLDSYYGDTTGWKYARPVSPEDIEALDNPNKKKIAELEETVKKALVQIEELKEK